MYKRQHVVFYAFTLVHIDDDIISWGDRMSYLSDIDVYKRQGTDKCIHRERGVCGTGEAGTRAGALKEQGGSAEDYR